MKSYGYRRYFWISTLALLVLCLTPCADADQLIESPVSLGPLALPFSNADTFLPAIDQFNLPYTLEDVEFLFTTSVTGTVNISQASGAAADYDLGFTADVSLYDPGNTTILVTDTSGTWNLTNQTVPDDGQTHAFSSTGSGSDTETVTSSANLADFIGSGTISLPVSGQGSASATGNIPYSVSGSGTAMTTVQVIYDYSTLAVPEPSYTILVGGLLLVGLSLVGRRNRQGKSDPKIS